MSCPICGRVYCDHTPAERGQTHEEMMADCCGMSVEEYRRRTADAAPTKRSHRKKKTRSAKKDTCS